MRALLCISIPAMLFGCAGSPDIETEPTATAQEAVGEWQGSAAWSGAAPWAAAAPTPWSAPAPALEPKAMVERAPARAPVRASIPLTHGALVLARIAACRAPSQSGLANAMAMRCLAAVLSSPE